MSLSAVPTEVVELILIFAAAAHSPETVAAFARTCRAHRELVYGASDSHLWREIFLATFDDPRESGGGPGWEDANAQRDVSAGKKDAGFDWGVEYRKRIWAAHYFTREAAATPTSMDEIAQSYGPDVVRRNICALDALGSVVRTVLYCSPSVVISFLARDTSGGLSTIGSEYPTFPPLSQVSRGSSGAFSTTYGHATSSRNIAWLSNALANGYPPSIIARFCGRKWEGGTAGQFLEEDEFREMQAAGFLIACTGFVPMPHNAAPPTSPVDGPMPAPPAASFMSEEAQRKRARRLARMRVYNMRYLGRERHWGPYLPCEEKKVTRVSSMPIDDDLLQPILALFHMPGIDHDDEEEEEAEDHDHEHEHEHGDEEDEEDDDEEHEHEHEDDQEHEHEEQGDEPGGAAEQPASRGAAGQPAASSAQLSPPTPAQLRPDWAYLAAVRTLVEANLREAFAGEDLSGLLSLEGLRPGSAPWDASHYKVDPSVDVATSDKGKGRVSDSDEDEVEGWDWAGVTGVWKRCVCWMDYRDLILHNLSGEFDDSRMGEAVRLAGMSIRIKRYSPSQVPAYAHLPTIHVVGESDGASSLGHPRRIHGTVGVIADGSVRWNLASFSAVDGGDADEWVSEGVQVGGVASAMGVLGMWTGASHERMDPLGPTWAWKVG
ncbi:hypothetical protein C2E23DRAFT_735138 [Lenzites betulinus]|nr:hypothetical protein C2E23DRAFT_735138 [Lenzites betulinus]